MPVFELKVIIRVVKKLPETVSQTTHPIPGWSQAAFRYGSAALTAWVAHVAMRDSNATNLFVEELIKALMR